MQERVLSFLAESGIVFYACKKAGVSRETFYTWKEDPVFADRVLTATEHGKSFVNDLALNLLIRSIQNGDFRAAKFQLERCHPDYRPKQPEKEISPEKKIPPITEIVIQPIKVKKTCCEPIDLDDPSITDSDNTS